MRQWEDLQQGLGEHFKTMTLQEAFDELMRDPIANEDKIRWLIEVFDDPEPDPATGEIRRVTDQAEWQYALSRTRDLYTVSRITSSQFREHRFAMTEPLREFYGEDFYPRAQNAEQLAVYGNFAMQAVGMGLPPDKFAEGLIPIWNYVQVSTEYQAAHDAFYAGLTDEVLLAREEAYEIRRLQDKVNELDDEIQNMPAGEEQEKLIRERNVHAEDVVERLDKMRRGILKARVISLTSFDFRDVITKPGEFGTEEQKKTITDRIVARLLDWAHYRKPVADYYEQLKGEVFDDSNSLHLGRLSYWVRFAKHNDLSPDELKELFDEVLKVRHYPVIKLLTGNLVEGEIDLEDPVDSGIVFNASLYKKAYYNFDQDDPGVEAQVLEHFRHELYARTFIPDFGTLQGSRYLQQVYRAIWKLGDQQMAAVLNGQIAFQPVHARALVENYYSTLNKQRMELDPKSRFAGGIYGAEVTRWENLGQDEADFESDLLRRIRTAEYWNQQVIRAGNETIRYIRLLDGQIEIRRDGITTTLGVGRTTEMTIGKNVLVQIVNHSGRDTEILFKTPVDQTVVTIDGFSVYRAGEEKILMYRHTDHVNDQFVNSMFNLFIGQGIDLATEEGLSSGRDFMDRRALRLGLKLHRRALLNDFIRQEQFGEISEEDLAGILLMSDRLIGPEGEVENDDAIWARNFYQLRQAEMPATHGAGVDVVQLRSFEEAYEEMMMRGMIQAADVYYKNLFNLRYFRELSPDEITRAMKFQSFQGKFSPELEQFVGRMNKTVRFDQAEEAKALVPIINGQPDLKQLVVQAGYVLPETGEADVTRWANESVERIYHLRDPRPLSDEEVSSLYSLRKTDGRSPAGLIRFERGTSKSEQLSRENLVNELVLLAQGDSELLQELQGKGLTPEQWAGQVLTSFMTEIEMGENARYHESRIFSEEELVEWTKLRALVQYAAYKEFGQFLPNLYYETYFILSYQNTVGALDARRQEYFLAMAEHIWGRSLEFGNLGKPGFGHEEMVREVIIWMKAYLDLSLASANGKANEVYQWLATAQGQDGDANGVSHAPEARERMISLLEAGAFLRRTTLAELGPYVVLQSRTNPLPQDRFVGWLRWLTGTPAPTVQREDNLLEVTEPTVFETLKVYAPKAVAGQIAKGRDTKFRNRHAIEYQNQLREEQSEPNLVAHLRAKEVAIPQVQDQRELLLGRVDRIIQDLRVARRDHDRNAAYTAEQELKRIFRPTEDRIERLLQIEVLSRLRASGLFTNQLYNIPDQLFQTIRNEFDQRRKPYTRRGVELEHESDYDYYFGLMVQKGMDWDDLENRFKLRYEFEPYLRLIHVLLEMNQTRGRSESLTALFNILESPARTKELLQILLTIPAPGDVKAELERSFGANVTEEQLLQAYQARMAAAIERLKGMGLELTEGQLNQMYRFLLSDQEKGSLGYYVTEMDASGMPMPRAAQHYALQVFIGHQEAELASKVLMELTQNFFGHKTSLDTQVLLEAQRKIQALLFENYGLPVAFIKDAIVQVLMEAKLLGPESVSGFHTVLAAVYEERLLHGHLDMLGFVASKAMERGVTPDEVQLAYQVAFEGWRLWVSELDISNQEEKLNVAIRFLKVHRHLADQTLHLGIGIGEAPPVRHLKLPILSPVAEQIRIAESQGDANQAHRHREYLGRVQTLLVQAILSKNLEQTDSISDDLVRSVAIEIKDNVPELQTQMDNAIDNPEDAQGQIIRQSLAQIVELRNTFMHEAAKLEGLNFTPDQLKRFVVQMVALDVVPAHIRIQIAKATRDKERYPKQVKDSEFKGTLREKVEDFLKIQRLKDEWLARNVPGFKELFPERVRPFVRKHLYQDVIINMKLVDDRYLLFAELSGDLFDPRPEMEVTEGEIIFRYRYANERLEGKVVIARTDEIDLLIRQGASPGTILLHLNESDQKRTLDLYDRAMQQVLAMQGMGEIAKLDRKNRDRLLEATEEARELGHREEQKSIFVQLHLLGVSQVEHELFKDKITFTVRKPNGKSVGTLTAPRNNHLDDLIDQGADSKRLILALDPEQREKAERLFAKAGDKHPTQLNAFDYLRGIGKKLFLPFLGLTLLFQIISLIFRKNVKNQTQKLLGKMGHHKISLYDEAVKDFEDENDFPPLEDDQGKPIKGVYTSFRENLKEFWILSRAIQEVKKTYDDPEVKRSFREKAGMVLGLTSSLFSLSFRRNVLWSIGVAVTLIFQVLPQLIFRLLGPALIIGSLGVLLGFIFVPGLSFSLPLFVAATFGTILGIGFTFGFWKLKLLRTKRLEAQAKLRELTKNKIINRFGIPLDRWDLYNFIKFGVVVSVTTLVYMSVFLWGLSNPWFNFIIVLFFIYLNAGIADLLIFPFSFAYAQITPIEAHQLKTLREDPRIMATGDIPLSQASV
ncbi:MAG: hypothetical protein HY585_03440, partial [Candidatus Omnitrophica bacterium]|nr:hypothetical protein [Candidatus Omnitrophota bacterium]